MTTYRRSVTFLALSVTTAATALTGAVTPPAHAAEGVAGGRSPSGLSPRPCPPAPYFPPPAGARSAAATRPPRKPERHGTRDGRR